MNLTPEQAKIIIGWWDFVQDATAEPEDELSQPEQDLLAALRAFAGVQE